MRKSSRLKDRKEPNINLILGSLRSLNPEFLACSKSRFFSHERYTTKLGILLRILGAILRELESECQDPTFLIEFPTFLQKDRNIFLHS
jgi:hypothetical protein